MTWGPGTDSPILEKSEDGEADGALGGDPQELQ